MTITNKMVLGTAQLGMDYGIANLDGKPSEKEAFKILEIAWNAGICHFDTAPAYNSEEIIGNFIKTNGIANEIKVLTKIPSLENRPRWKDFIYRTINDSYKKLGCSSLDVLFFHNAKDSKYILKEPEFFINLLREYSVIHLGVSVYSCGEITYLSGGEFDIAFQFPYNILDRRFEKINISKGLRFGRSVLLQGVLVSKTCLIDNTPVALKKIHKIIHDFFEKNKIDPLSFVLKFVNDSNYIDFFICGVENKKQLEQILAVDISCDYFYDELPTVIPKNNKKWLDPREWS